MRHRIEGILLAALSVAACSSEDEINPDDYERCPNGTIDGLSLASGVDGLELWEACSVENYDQGDGGLTNTATRIDEVGERCSSDECEAELAMTVAGFGGGRPAVPGGYYCVQHLVAFDDDQLATEVVLGDEAGFSKVVAGVDSISGAVFLAQFLQLGCSGIRVAGNNFEVLATEYSGNGCGDGEVWKVVYSISAAGEYEIIKEGEHESNDSCPGRRPPGLFPQPKMSGSHMAEPRTTCTELGAYFAELAGMEGASVAAFEQLRTELELHGAPKTLLQRLRVAAAEEAVHTRLMARLAQRFGGVFTPRRVAPPAPRSLGEIARENAREGCVFETWAALVALWQGRNAGDADVRSSMRRIARDELSHATLSWDLAAWLAPRLSSAQRAEADAVRREAVAELGAALRRDKHPERVRVAGIPDDRAERLLWSFLEPHLLSGLPLSAQLASGPMPS